MLALPKPYYGANIYRLMSFVYSSTFLLGTRVVLKLKQKLNSKFWQDLSDLSDFGFLPRQAMIFLKAVDE